MLSKIDVSQVKAQFEKLRDSVLAQGSSSIDDTITVDANLERQVDQYQREQEALANSRIVQSEVEARAKEIEEQLKRNVVNVNPISVQQHQTEAQSLAEAFKAKVRAGVSTKVDSEATRLAESLKAATKRSVYTDAFRTDVTRIDEERKTFALNQAKVEAQNAALNQIYEEGLTERRAAIDAIRTARRAAREAAETQGQSTEQQTVAADLAEQERISSNDRMKAVWERRQAARRLQDVLKMADIESKMKIAVADVNGDVHQIPEASVFMSEELQKALDWNMLPFVPWMSLLFSKSSLSSVPGVGTVNGAMETTNTILDIAQTVKKGIDIANIAMQMQGNEALRGVETSEAEKLDSYLHYRLPTLSGALESFVRAYGSVVPKEIVLRELGNAAIHPEMTTADVALNIGSQFILGERLGMHTADTIRSVGSWFSNAF